MIVPSLFNSYCFTQTSPSFFTILGSLEKLLFPIILFVLFLTTSRTGTVLILIPIFFKKLDKLLI